VAETLTERGVEVQTPADGVHERLAGELVERARAEGLSLTGPGGLLAG
jgi:hypothetical protein